MIGPGAEESRKGQEIPVACTWSAVWKPKAMCVGEKLLKPGRLGFKSQIPFLTSNASLIVSLP